MKVLDKIYISYIQDVKVLLFTACQNGSMTESYFWGKIEFMYSQIQELEWNSYRELDSTSCYLSRKALFATLRGCQCKHCLNFCIQDTSGLWIPQIYSLGTQHKVRNALLCKSTTDFPTRVDIEPANVLSQDRGIVRQPHLENLSLAGNLVGRYLDGAQEKHGGSDDDKVDHKHVHLWD